MLNPIRLCDDLFDDPKLSYNNLQSFTEDHLVSLANPENNPGGIYNAIITETTTKYNNYYGKMTNELVKKAIAEGTTITRNNARNAVETLIKGLEGGTKLKFGSDSAVYQELYPLGITEYTQAREGDVGNRFDRFEIAATTHLTAHFPTEVGDLSTLIASFHTAFTARETVVNQVDTAQTGKHEDRKILTVQLTINFLTIAINNIDNPDRFDDYYDPRFLPLSGDNGIRTGDIGGATILHITTSGLTINADTDIRLKNPGAVTLRYYFGPANNSAPDAVYIDVSPNDIIDTTAGALGWSPTNVFFLVQNTEAPSGKYRVEIG